ncbi:Asp23/Gls24 family envelope stress response protein [Pseudonocardia oroxyli]|uniref:Asp23 family, cell envelope-related function n=1 Tax=Pseudonocardia oroxyli TaxID=366584 RepID=A0A1G7WC07_PSEOR|nr:Asp23/Gls24 family envelope stress response protein [Pseudonocardia oroxyli]SDG69537.1 hypothetical protein SAMN05216377_11473 [Pseudonocardia oroxyli]
MAIDPEPIEPLACGRDAAQVWDHAVAGTLDEHERTCPHCRAAAADALGLDGVVHRFAAQRPTPPPTVLDAVLGSVRDLVAAELRPQDLIPLDSPEGPARLARPAAARVLRHLVDGMEGVRARSCRVGTTGVTMTVTARFGVDLASVTARVRQMVVAAAEQTLGLPVGRVDITVVDLWEEDPWRA